LLLLLATVAFSEDKIYTNKDLKAEPPISTTPAYGFEPLIKSSEFNWSFDELHRYIERRLAVIQIPQDKVYLRPLTPGMTTDQVKHVWSGATIVGGYGEDGRDWRDISRMRFYHVATLNYQIGVSLYFDNNKLKGWRTYKPPRFTIPRNEKVIDYQELKKEEKSQYTETATFRSSFLASYCTVKLTTLEV
jgi:hypothetical protein